MLSVMGGELSDALNLYEQGYLPENQARVYFRQLLDVLDYLHSLKIVHRDLKLENILFQDETKRQIKLIDFGLSRTIEHGSLFTAFCGTPEYLGM